MNPIEQRRAEREAAEIASNSAIASDEMKALLGKRRDAA